MHRQLLAVNTFPATKRKWSLSKTNRTLIESTAILPQAQISRVQLKKKISPRGGGEYGFCKSIQLAGKHLAYSRQTFNAVGSVKSPINVVFKERQADSGSLDASTNSSFVQGPVFLKCVEAFLRQLMVG